ncbi:Uncharacterised protein [Vibrio cholerae]|nr:Uncharacterised protein [Vibrio cholerae]
MRMHERRARQHQPHGFKHQLVGVGGAVESTRTRRVVSLTLHIEQRVFTHFTRRILLANIHFLFVTDAGCH